ncbi:hypothetical protein DYB36_006262 [Aphanomyces astaci]|uniref:Helicase ATP-binding domain-containing protein n=1 Tax=Aphanomyces astaci TaxID=112090 RepID=A0A396ZLX1_APHAT|nr:hypothetical protein DYB36_006262 [Aphanomyces astaci]
MGPHSTSAPLYNGPPLDDHNRTFLEWKPLFISQADGHEFTQFYMNKAYVPSDLERSILSILDDDVQVDKLKHPELYHVDPDLSEDGLAARHKVIADHVQSVKSATLKSETAKSLSRLRALALTFLNSSMVDSLRKLFSNIACPFTLYESIVSRFENNPLTSDPAVLNAQSQKVKYHDGDCLDTLLADVKSIASQYRTAMIPSSLEITAAEYDAFLWANHYMVKLSEVFLDDKQIWDLIRAISSNAKASGQPCSVAAIDAAIKDALATRHLRSLALGEHGTADSAPTRSHLINAAVVDAIASMHDVNWHKIFPKRIPVILRDLAPQNAFNPTNLWPEEAAAGGAAPATSPDAEKGKKEKKDKKAPVLKKADLIRLQLAKDLEEKKAKQDEEKLSNAKFVNLMDMKMATAAGRMKQLYEIKKEFLAKKNYIDAVDTLWEIQHTTNAPTEDEVVVHKKYKKYAKKAIDYLKDTPLIPFQLTEMSDRLPPLNLHHMNKFILDKWQKEVLTHIDQKHSVVVCAPTSSGKTVLSSYVSVIGGKVLFLAPTEPLVWQVAALFQAMVKGTVALVTKGTVFLPEGFRISVGTPAAVESALLDIGYDQSMHYQRACRLWGWPHVDDIYV